MKTPLVMVATLLLSLCAVPASASDADLCLAVDTGPGVDLTNPAAVRSGIVTGAIIVTEVVPCGSGAEPPVPMASEQPAASPSSAGSSPSAFDDGTWLVGTDIPAGLYRTDGGEGCYWARLSGLDGETSDVIADGYPDGAQLLTVREADIGFMTRDCGPWTPFPAPTQSSLSPSPSPNDSLGLHGLDLIWAEYDEATDSGPLPVRLSQFSKAWNREVDGMGSEFRLPTRPRVTQPKHPDESPTFWHDLPVSGVLRGRWNNIAVHGRLDDRNRLVFAVVTWEPRGTKDELEDSQDKVNAAVTFTSLPRAVDPGLTQDETNALFRALGYPAPGESWDGIEAQQTVNGIVYTLVHTEVLGITLIARRE